MDKQKQIRRWLTSYAKRYWISIVVLTFLSLLKIGFLLLNPWPIKILIDSVFGDIPAPGPLAAIAQPENLLLILAGGLILIYLLQNLLSLFNAYWTSVVDMKFDIDVRSTVFSRLLNTSLSSLSRKSLGDYIFRLNTETNSVRDIILSVNRSLLEAGLMITGSFAILLYLNWVLALLALVVVPFLYITVKHFSNRIETASHEIETNASALYSHTANSVQNIRTIQAFDQEPRQSKILHNLLMDRFRLALRNLLLHGKFGLANDMITTVAISGIIVIGGYAVLGGTLTIGEIIIFLTYITYLFGPLESLNATIGKYREDLAAAKRVYEIAEEQEPIREPKSPTPAGRVSGQVRFDNVSFWHHAEQPLLKDASFNITPGSKIVLIGPSGSGKSSFLNLLARFYEPTRGKILLDDIPIDSMSLSDLRRQFALVSQEPMLIAGTIGDNIAFGSSDPNINADSIEVRAAAEAANAHSFIDALPDKYQTWVGDKGVQLSGGQKQRIAIARAFLKDAPILLLDEPTSALDQEAELSLTKTLEKLMANRTTFIVTHREALLKDYSAVLRLKDGTLNTVPDPKAYLASLRAEVTPDTVFTKMYEQPDPSPKT